VQSKPIEDLVDVKEVDTAVPNLHQCAPLYSVCRFAWQGGAKQHNANIACTQAWNACKHSSEAWGLNSRLRQFKRTALESCCCATSCRRSNDSWKGNRNVSERQLTNVEGPGSDGSRRKGLQIGRVGLGPQLAHQWGQCFNCLRAVTLTVQFQSLPIIA